MEDALKPANQSEYVGQWVQAITAAKADEKDWRKDAEKAIKAFRGNSGSTARNFNIFHSNTQILVPAVYNSTPIPDVRRRFGDSDKAGKTAADMIERALSYVMDRYDFDARVKASVFDMAVTGRGVIRLRYEPEATEIAVTDQRVTCEVVPHDRFIRGPAVMWDDVPWIAFEHYLDRDGVEKLAPEMVDVVPFTHSATGKDDKTSSNPEPPAQFKRAHIYEIWDRAERKVIFICPEYTEQVVREEEDPLGLEGFFPIPRPIYAVAAVGDLTPVCPFAIYSSLIDELNDITRRIAKLVRQLRPRGGYVGNNLDVKALAEAGDGELIPLQGMEQALSTAGGGIERSIVWFPMEPTVLALRELYTQREAVKQSIYEVTGIADIMRGASAPSETATAQQLKAQFGSMRVRDLQTEVQRFVRDILRMKAELICRHFDPQVMMQMASIQLVPQAMQQQAMAMAQQAPEQAQQIAAQNPELAKAIMERPSLDEVFGILKSDQMRAYRIDIETDSTIRGDMMQAQQQMGAFMQGASQYMQAVGPLVQQGTIPPGPAIELFAAFTRNFNLGKSAEDALDRLGEAAGKAPPKQEGEGENRAEMAKVEMQGQAKQAELQMKERHAQQQAAMQAQAAEREAALMMQLEQMKAEIEVMKVQAKAETDRYKIDRDTEAKVRNGALQAFTAMNRPASPPR